MAKLTLDFHTKSLARKTRVDLFIPSLNLGGCLRNQDVKINDVLASEFYINALYASYLGVPVAFLSGDLKLTEFVKSINSNIKTVATKEGIHGAVISKHPNVTNQDIEEQVKLSLTQDLSTCYVPLPKHFNVEIQYKKFNDIFYCIFFCKWKIIIFFV